MKYFTTLLLLILLSIAGCKKEHPRMYAAILSPAEGSTFHSGDSITVDIKLYNAERENIGAPIKLSFKSLYQTSSRNLIANLVVSNDTIYHAGFVLSTDMPDTIQLYAEAGYVLGSQTYMFAPQTTIYILP